MCYTTPSAHVTLGQPVGNAFLEKGDARTQLSELVEESNERLREEGGTWKVGEQQGLNMQLGYLKLGRARQKAGLVGQPDVLEVLDGGAVNGAT
jgi:hypothetical protein